MDDIQEAMQEYQRQMAKGVIPVAYRGLMEFMLELRTHFSNRHADFSVSGSLYQGYMDMTYFSVTPVSMRQLNLKVAVVFLHEDFRFEVWLAGVNKQIQAQYWKLFKDSGWDQYHLVASPRGSDAILEHVLVKEPDFSDLPVLTRRIERGTLAFIEDVETYLAGSELV